MDRILFFTSFILYGVALVLFFCYAITRLEKMAKQAQWFLSGGFICHFFSLIVRTVVAHQMPNHTWYIPWSNWFESFSFFALVIMAVYLVIQYRGDVPFLGVFIAPLAFFSMVMAVHAPSGDQIPLIRPQLHSYWMAMHIPVMFAAYAAFANAFAIGLVYLIQERQLKSKKPSSIVFRLPALDNLDNLIFKVIACAFPAFTLGLLLGSMWAYQAWGRYWGWDAKEAWAFVSWLVYLLYLIIRVFIGWRGRKTAYLSLLGFIIVLFTYVGVNYLSELHGFLPNVQN